jgi:hypothetical protein
MKLPENLFQISIYFQQVNLINDHYTIIGAQEPGNLTLINIGHFVRSRNNKRHFCN